MAGSFSDAELKRPACFLVGNPSGLLVALRFCPLIVSEGRMHVRLCYQFCRLMMRRWVDRQLRRRHEGPHSSHPRATIGVDRAAHSQGVGCSESCQSRALPAVSSTQNRAGKEALGGQVSKQNRRVRSDPKYCACM
jgi:hypothetical protein